MVTLSRAPQADGLFERMIGTHFRECFDKYVVLDDLHAEGIVRDYVRYYLGRSHRGLQMQAPAGVRCLPPALPVAAKAVRPRPLLGGLYHEYAIAT